MTHEDKGKYAAKHASGTALNEKIAEAVREKTSDGRIACGTCENISKDLGVEIREVGLTADLLERKITTCQLGLFGYAGKANHGKDIQVADSVTEEMKSTLREATENGKVACASVWAIADQAGAKRKEVSSACETLKLKIGPCQLGAF